MNLERPILEIFDPEESIASFSEIWKNAYDRINGIN